MSVLLNKRIGFYILALLLLPMSVLAEESFSFNPNFSLESAESDTIKHCKKMKTDLKKEQQSIKTNEKALSLKIDRKDLKRDDLNQLIKAHLSSIDDYNREIESFNVTCTNIPVPKKAVAVTPVKKQTKTLPLKEQPQAIPAKQAVVEPVVVMQSAVVQPENQSFVSAERWKQVMLSKEKISNMHGYFLQVGAFKNENLASKLIKNLSNKDFNMHKIIRPYVDAVWTGSFTSLTELNEAKHLLKSTYGLDSYIIKLK